MTEEEKKIFHFLKLQNRYLVELNRVCAISVRRFYNRVVSCRSQEINQS